MSESVELIDPANVDSEEHERKNRHEEGHHNEGEEAAEPGSESKEKVHPLIISHVETNDTEDKSKAEALTISEYSTDLRKEDELLMPEGDHLS